MCPGLNNVIRALVNVMWYRYGVRRILGIRHGFAGLVPGYRFAPMELHPEVVSDCFFLEGV